MAGLLDFINSPAGMGLLSAVASGAAGARRGTPLNNLGRGALGGLAGYSQAQGQLAQQDENALAKQMKQMQMDQMQRQMADQEKMRSGLQALYKPSGTEPFQADNPFGENLGTLQNETPATFGGKNVDPVMAAVLPYAQPDDILKMFSPSHQNKTAEQKNYEFAMSLPEDQRSAFMGSNSTIPASVAEWQFYNQLPPDKQPGYLEMKRNPQIMNLGGSMAVRAPGGGVSESYAVAPKITETPNYAAAVAGAETQAKESVKLQADRAASQLKAQSDLPRIEDSANFTRKMVDGVLNHPGLPSSVGFTMTPGAHMIPGTQQADFKARLDQLKGSAFLEAFSNLKGGGSITETEGKKAESAINRMSTSTSEKEFRQAGQDFLEVVSAAERRAKKSAGQEQPRKVKKYNPATGRIE